MAITFVQKRKYQKYLILIFGALIAIIIFVFFGDYLKKEDEFGEIFVGESVTTKHLPPIKIDFQVLDNPIFQKLTEPFPDLPPAYHSREVGRENPFLPYEGYEEPSGGGFSGE